MKTPSNELYELINVLTLQEQKDFKNYCINKSGDNSADYIKLFEAFTKLKGPDDEALQKSLKLKNYVRIKNYLHTQLLEFMTREIPYSAEQEICKLLILANTLNKRALPKQSLAVLYKALQKANDFQLFSYSIVIEDKITQIEVRSANIDYLEKYSGTHLLPYIENVTNEIELHKYAIKTKLFYLRQDRLFRDTAAMEEFDALMEPFLTKGEDYPKTFRGKLFYNTSNALYHMEHKNFEKALIYHEKSRKLYEIHENIKNEDLTSYTVFANNLLMMYSLLNKWSEYKLLLKDVKTLSSVKGNHTNFAIEVYLVNQSHYLFKNPLDPDSQEDLKELENDLIKHTHKITLRFKIIAILNISICHFMNSNFKSALEWVNKLDEFDRQSILVDSLSIAKLYRLIIYFEMNKIDLLEFSILNTYRFLNKNDKYYNFEKRMFSILKKLFKVDTKDEQTEIYKSTYREFLELQKDPLNQNAFEAFNFAGWIKCKLSGNNFLHIMDKS